MIIIGEKINSSRKEVAEAIEHQDAALIRDLARRQADAGADYIDVNCGTFEDDEAEILCWMVREVQDEIGDVPLCIDSRSALAVEAALKTHRGSAMVNSISGETERFDAMMPLIRGFHAKAVALCMGEGTGIPVDAQTRYEVACDIIDRLAEQGVPNEDVYIDPLIQPISVDPSFGVAAADTIRMVRKKYPATHAVCGLSNVSFELPERKLLNQAYMVICAANGLDAVILNPEDRAMMRLVYASDALLNRDPYCRNYLTAFRNGKLEI